ncbi:helix-turn-helix transcriptional regulator [Candidatus Fermentibacterales bacterium]|nr:helix-turn-helix transcriptional regulator [Candidatus Fermentibacterales bacterium]
MKARRIYNRIAVLRSERGVSRKELAGAVGVNPQTIGYLERQEYNPSLDLAFRICEYFGFPVEFVFSTGKLEPISEELMRSRRSSEA